jgi:hypothetical protein
MLYWYAKLYCFHFKVKKTYRIIGPNVEKKRAINGLAAYLSTKQVIISTRGIHVITHS